MKKIKDFFKRLNFGKRINNVRIRIDEVFENTYVRIKELKKSFDDKLLSYEKSFDNLLEKVDEELGGIKKGFMEEVDKIVEAIENQHRETNIQVKAIEAALDEMRHIIAYKYTTPKYMVGDIVDGKEISERIPTFIQVSDGYSVVFQYKLKNDKKRYNETEIDVLRNRK